MGSTRDRIVNKIFSNNETDIHKTAFSCALPDCAAMRAMVPEQRCAHARSPENSPLELVGEAVGQDCGSTAARPRFESTPNAPSPYADQQVYHYDSAGMPTSTIPELVDDFERDTKVTSSYVRETQSSFARENKTSYGCDKPVGSKLQFLATEDADTSASSWLLVLALLILLNVVVFGSFSLTSLFAEPVPAELPCAFPLFPMPCH